MINNYLKYLQETDMSKICARKNELQDQIMPLRTTLRQCREKSGGHDKTNKAWVKCGVEHYNKFVIIDRELGPLLKKTDGYC